MEMALDSPPTELILNGLGDTLGQVHLDWTPQPGNHIEFAGSMYQVLERRHRYRLKANRYQLHKIALYIQPVQKPEETHLIDNRWIIGEPSCRFNARSEMIRCAVNPAGPCKGCKDYEPLLSTSSHS